MTIRLRALSNHIGAQVEGIDLRKPLSAEDAEIIHHEMDRYAVLVFREQHLDDAQHLAFTQALGEMEDARGSSLRAGADFRLPTTFADVSNLDGNNQVFAAGDRRRLFAIGNRLWHSDSSFKPTPAKYSLLRAVRIPSRGGNTEFAHMGAAYDALDDETKTLIQDLVCEHSQLYSRESVGFSEFTHEERVRFKPVRQRLVRSLPRTGRKSLYLSSHAGTIVGWTIPEARLLLRDLNEHATQRQFVYSHAWREGDLVMWDNRQTMHRARPYPADEPRDMRRTTLRGEGPTVADEPVEHRDAQTA
jgi:alpha-ketoglutarate-dependent 2,4-dichlorophenoxyacetate dioxygenase